MAYQVIKRIKGIDYLYLQETYRDGEHVRTKSKYLGRVDTKTGELHPAEPPASSVLDNKIDLQKYAISQATLEEVHATLLTHLAKINVNTTNYPLIRLRHGKNAVCYRQTAKNMFTVYLPKSQEGNRAKFHDVFRKTLALAALELIKAEHPKLYDQIAYQFNASYRQTQNFINAYILNTNDRQRRFKALALKWWGIYHPTYKNPLNEAEIGLTGLIRKNWQDEFSDLMGDVLKFGFHVTLQEWRNKQETAISSERYAVNEYLRQKKETNFIFRIAGWTKKAKKAWKRAYARRQAQEEIQRKLAALNEVFQFTE